jgi:hypothetical protein
MTWLFYFQEEGIDGWTFIIEAKDHIEALEKAYETHGPQVLDMYYRPI